MIKDLNLEPNVEEIVHALAFYPDGGHILQGGIGPMILRRLSDGEPVRGFVGQSQPLGALALTTSMLAVADFSGKHVRFWDLRRGTETLPLDLPTDKMIGVMDLSDDNEVLGLGYDDGHIEVWNLATRKLMASFSGHSKQITALALDRDKTRVLSGSEDETARVWRIAAAAPTAATRNPEHIFTGYGGTLGLVQFEPSGSIITVSFGHTCRIIDLATGAVTKTWTDDSKNITTAVYAARTDVMLGITKSFPQSTAGLYREGKPPIRLNDNQGIQNAAIAADGKLAVTADTAAFLRFWDGLSGREIVAFLPSRQGGWTAISPEGPFDTTDPEQSEALNWVVTDDPLKPQSVQIFMREYYTPKLLPKLLNGDSLPHARPLSSVNRTQPGVQITSVDPEPGHPGFVRVSLKVTSVPAANQKQESGVYDVRLFRDGALIALSPAISDSAPSNDLQHWREIHRVLSTGEKSITFEHVALPQRSSVKSVVFSAYAFNSDRVRSEIDATEYKMPAARTTRIRTAYIISVGVNANQSGWDLNFAVPSAREMTDLLKRKLARSYDQVVPITIFSDLGPDGAVQYKDATKPHMRAAFDLLAGRPVSDAERALLDPQSQVKAVTPDDAVILYIASHGYASADGGFYVVPYDTGTQRGLTEPLIATCLASPAHSALCAAAHEFLTRSISSDDLAAWWQGVDAAESIIVLDSCHSAAAPGPDFRPGPLGDRGFGQLAYDKGIVILAATQADRLARGTIVDGLGHTLLVEALDLAAKESPNAPLDEWLRTAEIALPERARKLYNSVGTAQAQTPELLDFGVARARRAGR